MSSASIQLAAVGMQDIYLYGKPDVSYFSGVFRRHSPFLLNSEEYPFNTPIQFGGSGFVRLPYKGDLLMGASLKLVLPPLFTPGPGWCYPVPTNIQSNVNPYFNEYNYVDAQTQSLIRTNIPNFKVYFSDGANTICYVQRSVKYYNTYSPTSNPESVTFTGQLSSARLILVTYSNSAAMTSGQNIVFPTFSTSVANITVPSCVNSNTVTATINSTTGIPLVTGMTLTNVASISDFVYISSINYDANNIPVTMNLSFRTQSFSGFTQNVNLFYQTKISNPYKVQTLDSGGVNFTYITIDITFSPSYLFTPLYAPVFLKVYDKTTLTEVSNAYVLSPTSVPWVKNDFISVTYDNPTNAWRWKSIYSLVKPFSNVYFNITSNTHPVPTGSNIIGLPFFTGNVTTTTALTSNIVTPVNISTTEYITMNNAPRIPITIQLSDQVLCQSNLINIQYPSQFDFSNLNMTFTDFKFNQTNITIGKGLDAINILAITIAPGGNVITTVNTVNPPFDSNTLGTLYNGLNPVFYTNFSNIVVGSPTTLEFSNIQILKDTTILGLPYKATIKTVSNSYTSNTVFTSLNSQPIIPITSNVSVSFSTGGTGNVSYSFYNNPITIKKLAFPTAQSAVFWGFDPAALAFTGARA
jgi:hypothetical protein